MTRSPASPGALRASLAESMASCTNRLKRNPSPSASTVKRDVYYLRQSEKAIHVQTDDDATVWIPKSQVRNLSNALSAGEGVSFTVEVSSWMAGKLGWA